MKTTDSPTKVFKNTHKPRTYICIDCGVEKSTNGGFIPTKRCRPCFKAYTYKANHVFKPYDNGRSDELFVERRFS